MKQPKPTIVIGIFLIIAGWFALVLQMIVLQNTAATSGIPVLMATVNYFSYFTILSNLLVALSRTIGLFFPETNAGKFFNRYTTQSAICVYIVIVGLVYSIALRNVWAPTGWQKLADHLLHDLIPLVYLVYWLIAIPPAVLKYQSIPKWLLFPGIYLVYSLVRGYFTHWYPYPFIQASELGYGTTLINSAFVLLAFIVVSLLLIFFNRARRRPRIPVNSINN
jgi:hypothetical protein